MKPVPPVTTAQRSKGGFAALTVSRARGLLLTGPTRGSGGPGLGLRLGAFVFLPPLLRRAGLGLGLQLRAALPFALAFTLLPLAVYIFLSSPTTEDRRVLPQVCARCLPAHAGQLGFVEWTGCPRGIAWCSFLAKLFRRTKTFDRLLRHPPFEIHVFMVQP